jgi:hypothetical protein
MVWVALPIEVEAPMPVRPGAPECFTPLATAYPRDRSVSMSGHGEEGVT